MSVPTTRPLLSRRVSPSVSSVSVAPILQEAREAENKGRAEANKLRAKFKNTADTPSSPEISRHSDTDTSITRTHIPTQIVKINRKNTRLRTNTNTATNTNTNKKIKNDNNNNNNSNYNRDKMYCNNDHNSIPNNLLSPIHNTQDNNPDWRICDKNCFLYPTSIPHRLWSSLILVLLYLNLTVLGLMAFYIPHSYENNPNILILMYIIDLFVLFDCIIELRTGYYDDYEHFIAHPKILFLRAIKDGWVLYVLSCVPFELFFIQEFPIGSRTFALLQLHRSFRLYRLAGSGIDLGLLTFKLRLLRITGLLFLAMHWMAGIVLCIGEYQVDAHKNYAANPDSPSNPNIWTDIPWPVRFGFYEANDFTRYISAYYWMAVCFLTTGYGDYFPITNLEKILTIFVLVAGVMFSSLLLSLITLAIRNQDQSNLRLEEGLHEISLIFTVYPQLPSTYLEQFKKTFRSIWKVYMGFDMNQVLDSLPSQYNTETKMFLHRPLVERVPWFARCGDGFLTDIVSLLSTRLVSSNEYIFHKGESSECMYFLSHGTVEVVEFNQILQSGAFFGEFGLIYSQPRVASIRTVTNVELCVLSKSDFQAVLLMHPRAAKIVINEARKRKAADKKREKMENDKANKLNNNNNKNNNKARTLDQQINHMIEMSILNNNKNNNNNNVNHPHHIDENDPYHKEHLELERQHEKEIEMEKITKNNNKRRGSIEEHHHGLSLEEEEKQQPKHGILHHVDNNNNTANTPVEVVTPTQLLSRLSLSLHTNTTITANTAPFDRSQLLPILNDLSHRLTLIEHKLQAKKTQPTSAV